MRRKASEAERQRANSQLPAGASSSNNASSPTHKTPASGQNTAPGTPRDEYVDRRLKPVRDNLGRLKKTNTAKMDRNTVIKVMKQELIAIGNFIRAETRDNKDLEDRLW